MKLVKNAMFAMLAQHQNLRVGLMVNPNRLAGVAWTNSIDRDSRRRSGRLIFGHRQPAPWLFIVRHFEAELFDHLVIGRRGLALGR